MSIEGQIKKSSTNTRFECTYCGKVFQGSVSRVLDHLLHRTNQIAKCKSISREDQADLQADQEKKSASKATKEQSKRLIAACKLADEEENEAKRLKQLPIGQSLERATPHNSPPHRGIDKYIGRLPVETKLVCVVHIVHTSYGFQVLGKTSENFTFSSFQPD